MLACSHADPRPDCPECRAAAERWIPRILTADEVAALLAEGRANRAAVETMLAASEHEPGDDNATRIGGVPVLPTTPEGNALVDGLLAESRAVVGPPMRRSCLHEQPGGPCPDCTERAARPAPEPSAPPLARVALVPPEDAATLAVLRGLVADRGVRELLDREAAYAEHTAEGHDERARASTQAQHAEAARHWTRVASLYRALSALHTASVPHAESVPPSTQGRE